MKFFVAVLAMLAASIAFLVAPSTAGADPFPAWFTADNEQHTFCFPTFHTRAVPAANQPRYRDAMSYLDVSTKLYDNEVTCTALTDVRFLEADLGALRGLAECLDASGNTCGQFEITSNPTRIFNESYYVYPGGGQPLVDSFAINMTKTARHEVGHSIGLNNDGQTYSDFVT